jgi:hypothetical protein
MKARAEHLVGQGLARREGQRILLQPNLLANLRRRELDVAGKALAAETGLTHIPAKAGQRMSGIYRRQVNLSSGRLALIEVMTGDGGLGFQLVPWNREIEKKLGQQITGIHRSDGGIEWSLGRKRALGLDI